MQRSLWHQTRNRPIHLTYLVVQQMMARFCHFYSLWKVKIWVKKGQKGAMCFKQVQIFIYVKKNFGGLVHFKCWVMCHMLVTYYVFACGVICDVLVSLYHNMCKSHNSDTWLEWNYVCGTRHQARNVQLEKISIPTPRRFIGNFEWEGVSKTKICTFKIV